MIRTYEVLYIVKPTIVDEEVGEIIDALANVAAENGCKVLAKGKWDRRKLAYEINGYKDGAYCLMYVEAEGNMPAVLYREFRINDDILRGIVTVVDTRFVDASKIETPKPVDDKDSSNIKPGAVTLSEAERDGIKAGELLAAERKIEKTVEAAEDTIAEDNAEPVETKDSEE